MEAPNQACQQQEEASRLCEQECDEASARETLFNDTIKDTREVAEGLDGVSGDHGIQTS